MMRQVRSLGITYLRTAKRNYVDIATVAAITSTATLGCYVGYSKWKSQQYKNKVTTYQQNVIRTLQKPFLPPIQPTWGPVFKRGPWEEEFKKTCRKKMYIIYYGPSELGKSVAVTHALQGEEGVIHIDLRQIQPMKIASCFASALGLFGDQVQSPAETNFVVDIFREAIKKVPFKPVVIVEDIHSVEHSADALEPPISEFAAQLLNLHRGGYINVVYTVSDFRATRLLSRVSGHSSTLRVERFPAIPDNIFAPQLAQLALEHQFNRLDRKPPRFKFIERVVAHPGTNFVLRKDTEAEYIVQHLDSHMGHTLECLRLILEEGTSVQESVGRIIKQHSAMVVSLFVSNIDPFYIATAYLIFEALCQDGIEKIDWFKLLQKEVPNMTRIQSATAVAYLVDSNILNYDGPIEVSLHFRSLKWAYLEYVKTNPEIYTMCNRSASLFREGSDK